MAERAGGTQAAFCPDCGMQLWSQWGFCPRCGRGLDDLHVSLWENASGPMVPPPAVRSPEAGAALELLRAGLTTEAEERLRASMRESPADVEARLILADMLLRRFEIQEAGALYDEAASTAPDHFMARLRRAEFLARLGRYSDAAQDLSAARKLPAPDFQTLMYCQEMYRWVSSRQQGSFTRTTGPPKIPAWVRDLSSRVHGAMNRRKHQRGGNDNAVSDAVHGHAGAYAPARSHANRRSESPRAGR